MRYYTQLIFVKPGKSDAFQRFEAHVLPLLGKHNGKLLLRWQRAPGSVVEGPGVESSIGDPDEVHLVSFPSVEDFRNFANDETRKSFLSLKDESVERVLLIEGTALS